MLGILGLFSLISLPHTDNVPIIDVTRRPYHDHHPFPQHARRDEADFSVVLAVVLVGKVLSRKDQRRILKIQSALFESLLAFGGIVGDLRLFIIATYISNTSGACACNGPFLRVSKCPSQ